MKPIVAAIVVALGLVAGPAATASAPGAGPAGRAVTVDIDHFKYHPPTLVVGKGTKVVFANSSRVAHTATDRGVFDSGRIKPGESFSVRFAQKGTFAYHCKIHHRMRGEIVVR
jgi:plastocyanin